MRVPCGTVSDGAITRRQDGTVIFVFAAGSWGSGERFDLPWPQRERESVKVS